MPEHEPLQTRHDAGPVDGAGYARTDFERAVVGRFGKLPDFFRSATAAPGLIEELWAFAASAYPDDPRGALRWRGRHGVACR